MKKDHTAFPPFRVVRVRCLLDRLIEFTGKGFSSCNAICFRQVFHGLGGNAFGSVGDVVLTVAGNGLSQEGICIRCGGHPSASYVHNL